MEKRTTTRKQSEGGWIGGDTEELKISEGHKRGQMPFNKTTAPVLGGGSNKVFSEKPQVKNGSKKGNGRPSTNSKKRQNKSHWYGHRRNAEVLWEGDGTPPKGNHKYNAKKPIGDDKEEVQQQTGVTN